MQTQAPSTGTPGIARVSVCLFLALSCFYLLLARGRITSGDEWHIYGTAESLAERGSWRLQVEGISRAYSRYSVVPSILAVPFCKAAGPVADRLAVQEGSHRASGLTRRDILMAAGTYETPLVTAATAAILFLGLCKLGIRPGPSLAATAVFALATPALPYSGSLYTQPAAALALIGVVLSAALGMNIVLAVSLMLLVTIRMELIAVVPALGFHALRFQRPAGRTLGWLVVGAAAGCALNVLVNQLRNDHWLTGDYGSEAFSTPLWVGLWGVLFSSGKGLVWFAPAATAGLVLLPRFVQSLPRVGLLAASVTVTLFIMVACWWTWHGAWSWGPRLLVPLMPVLVLPIASFFQGWQQESAANRWVMIVVLIASVAAQFPGLLRDPSADRSAMSLIIGGNENESIYIPQVGPWGAETNSDLDLFLCRFWRQAPECRRLILVITTVLATLIVAFGWCTLRSAGVRLSDVHSLVPPARPIVLLAMAGALVGLASPTALQWLLLAQATDSSRAPTAELPGQFRSFRPVGEEGRWLGSLYIPLRGDYVFYQQGPALTPFLMDGRPLFAATSMPLAVGLASDVAVGFHRLEFDGSESVQAPAIYWTTPGNAHYKEPIPRLYLTGPSVTPQRRAAIMLAHWKWSVWSVIIVALLFITARSRPIATPPQAGQMGVK